MGTILQVRSVIWSLRFVLGIMWKLVNVLTVKVPLLFKTVPVLIKIASNLSLTVAYSANKGGSSIKIYYVFWMT